MPARGGDAFRAKMLTLEEAGAYRPGDETACWRFLPRSSRAASCSPLRRLLAACRPCSPGKRCLVFRREMSAPSEWFNDDAYADNLNPDAVAAFLDITYEAYQQEIGPISARPSPASSRMSPNFHHQRSPRPRRCLPWTDGLPQFFLARRGWDLLEGLPWLFFEGERAAEARHDYWWTISERFTRPIRSRSGNGARRNGLAFTGHYLYEHEMGRAILHGGAVMPHYRYQQVPGIDMLTEQNHEFLTIKQCSSVANQFGRQRVLSETYGCSGWEFTFEGQKWNGDWQYVLGVNLRCQHLALYSLRGCRKRDYPPAFNYNTTWWKYNAVVEDYFARVGRVLSQGQAVRDVLVLHPVATGWAMLGEGDAVQAARWMPTPNASTIFVQALLAAHYDFDFGDEQIMAADGRVEGQSLVVGQAPYQAGHHPARHAHPAALHRRPAGTLPGRRRAGHRL